MIKCHKCLEKDSTVYRKEGNIIFTLCDMCNTQRGWYLKVMAMNLTPPTVYGNPSEVNRLTAVEIATAEVAPTDITA
jgi:hypothetical protein